MAIVKDSELDKRKRNGAKTALEPFTEQSLALLASKSPGELVALIKLCCRPELLDAALLSEEEAIERLMTKSLDMALNATDSREFIANANLYLDRKIGKAVERSESKISVATIDLTEERKALRQQALEYMQIAQLATVTTPKNNVTIVE